MSKPSRPDRELTRREILIRTAYATFLATGLQTPGVVFGANQLLQTPGMTEGPYFLDTAPNRSTVTTSTSTGAAVTGFKFNLAISVSKLANNVVTPVAAAKVDIWYAAPNGHYSGFAAEGTAGLNYLRGYQLTDKRGAVAFTGTFPGWYSGRTPHIHCKVRLYTGTTLTYTFTTQLFMDETFTAQVYALAPYSARPGPDTAHARDMIYSGASQGNGAAVASQAGSYTLLRLGKNATQANGSFNIVL